MSESAFKVKNNFTSYLNTEVCLLHLLTSAIWNFVFIHFSRSLFLQCLDENDLQDSLKPKFLTGEHRIYIEWVCVFGLH